jgi:tetratricopeptide (TPR) repeat protein
MYSIRRWFLLLLCLAVGGVAGCSRHKEITSLERKEAANFVSEAEFALNLRDYARAEGLLSQAVAVCPDTPDYWLNLGSVRRRLGNRDGAKAAYEQMLDLVRDIYRHDSKDPGLLLQQIYVLALLGRMDEARAVLERAQKDHPDDGNVRAFVEGHQLERLPTDPTFKDSAL